MTKTEVQAFEVTKEGLVPMSGHKYLTEDEAHEKMKKKKIKSPFVLLVTHQELQLAKEPVEA